MTHDQPYLPRPGIDERVVVAEMMGDQHPEHWEACSKFVERCVHAKAKNIPVDLHEDIAQEVMYRVAKALEQFRFESTLKTWVNLIIVNYIIDMRRRLQNEAPPLSHFHLATSPIESDYEGEEPGTGEEKSAEEAFMINDEIRNGWAACLEYVNTHANSIRNQLIIWMVIHEGHTHTEAALAAGCHAPVVGDVVRKAQRYAREKMGHKP